MLDFLHIIDPGPGHLSKAAEVLSSSLAAVVIAFCIFSGDFVVRNLMFDRGPGRNVPAAFVARESLTAATVRGLLGAVAMNVSLFVTVVILVTTIALLVLIIAINFYFLHLGNSSLYFPQPGHRVPA